MITAYLDPIGFGPIPSALTLSPVAYRSTVDGGPVWAEIDVTGPEAALWEVLAWLRRPLTLYDDGEAVWWGLVAQVRVTIEGLSIGLSLDKMSNRVAVTYSEDGIDYQTAWSADNASVTTYGYKELIEDIGEGSAAAAAAKVAELLASRAQPGSTLSIQARGAHALITCMGWWETLSWRVFNRLEGRVEWDGGNAEPYTQKLGWSLTSTQLGFSALGDRTIDDLGARLAALDTDDLLTVSGAANATNNKNFTITRRASSAGQTIVTGTNIAFNAVDDITATADALNPIKNGLYLLVAGSAANSRYHLIDTAGALQITTHEGITGNIAAEAAGPLITLTQGHAISVAESVATAIPGANVTVRITATEIAQAFTVAAPMVARRLAVTAAAIGSPADGLELSLRSDSAGNPSTSLGAVTLAGSTLDDGTDRRWGRLATGVALAPGTTYWLCAKRTGAASASAFYAVEMAKTTYAGACKIYNGAAWVAHPAGASLPFAVWGEEDTITQIARMITDCGQFISGQDLRVATSGITTNEYRNSNETALAEIQKLRGLNDSTGQRLLVGVTLDRRVRIYPEPPAGELRDSWANGQIHQALGGKRPRGRLPVGEWLTLSNVPQSINSALALSPRFVDEAEYNVVSDEMTLRFKGG